MMLSAEGMPSLCLQQVGGFFICIVFRRRISYTELYSTLITSFHEKLKKKKFKFYWYVLLLYLGNVPFLRADRDLIGDFQEIVSFVEAKVWVLVTECM